MSKKKSVSFQCIYCGKIYFQKMDAEMERAFKDMQEELGEEVLEGVCPKCENSEPELDDTETSFAEAGLYLKVG